MEISPVPSDVEVTRAEASPEPGRVAAAVVLGACAVASAAVAWSFARRLAKPSPFLARLGSSTLASSLGAMALGACATGAFATGSLAIGAAAIGRLRIKRLEIETLRVGRWESTRTPAGGVEPYWP